MPQQNGIAERFNQTVVEMARTMLHHAHLPYVFWAEAINTATYIRNRCISRALDEQSTTPEERWSSQKPDISHLRVFGCDAYALVKDQRHKLEPKAEKCILVGYSTESKAYRLWSNEKRRLIISRDVKFNECCGEHFNALLPSSISFIDTPNTPDISYNTPDIVYDTPETPNITQEIQEKDTTASTKSKKRLRKEIQSELGPYWGATATESSQNRIDYAYAYVAASTTEPQTYEDAISSPDAAKWKHAMNEEYASLLENETWELTHLPPNRTVIDTRWIYKVKHTSDGNIDRYKARLVAKGYAQHHGVDYEETYSPVYKLASLRTILSIGATLNLEIHQLDVKTAFLNGEIDTEIYVKQPQGYEQDRDLVCKLKKGLYGLKQAPRLWNKKINEFLNAQGFKRCISDLCIYQKETCEGITIIGLWVDDITIIAPLDILDSIKRSLKAKFKMTDQGPISYILGVSVTRDRSNRILRLQQTRYIHSLLERFNMVDCNPTCTPADPSIKLSKPLENEIINDKPYQQAIGALMYLMLATRPDITAALTKLSQFAISYSSTHWTALKRIFRYIKGTANNTLVLGGLSGSTQPIILKGSCDADWAGDTDDRRSTTGYIFLINNHAISWQTHKQNSVATSSTQAEYQALSSATKEAIWLRNLLEELGFRQQEPTTIQQDNKLTITLVNNLTNHKQTKHIDIVHHFVCECIEEKKITLEYCPTEDIIADAMTKPLTRAKFEHCKKNMVYDK